MNRDIQFLHNDDLVEIAREGEISFYIVNQEQAEDRELVFIKKLIKSNRGES